MAIKVVVSEFKGNPMLELHDGDNDRYPFRFGAAKAKKVIEALQDPAASAAIQKFIVDADAKKAAKKTEEVEA